MNSVDAVQVIPFGVGWAVRVASHEGAESFHFTKGQAVEAAERLASKSGGEVMVVDEESGADHPEAQPI